MKVRVAAKQLASRDRRRRWRLIAASTLHGLVAGLGLVAMLALALHAAEQQRIAAEMAAGLVFLTVALIELWAGMGLAWQSLQSGRIAADRLQAIVGQPRRWRIPRYRSRCRRRRACTGMTCISSGRVPRGRCCPACS